MSFYKRLGIDTYINAHDTYTIYGGSRMPAEALEAMKEAAASFVDIDQMQQILGDKIAEMTNNAGCYITNGAASGITLATAVCMTGDSQYNFSRLPEISAGVPNEVIVMRCQRNGYDTAIRAAGAVIIEIGDADETLEYELEGAINSKTAAVFYFENANFAQASMPLEKVISIAHSKNIPVVVDAAAQIPPVENLWKFTTEMGADLALFSGGKTLCGPQDSGLIVGRTELIASCRKFGAPHHGICRGTKTSREAMAGLFAALERYMSIDPISEYSRLEAIALQLGEVMQHSGFKTELVPFGPVGQAYPRIFGQCKADGQAQRIAAAMKARKIYIGTEHLQNRIYISPLNLTQEEAAHVGVVLGEVLAQEVR